MELIKFVKNIAQDAKNLPKSLKTLFLIGFIFNVFLAIQSPFFTIFIKQHVENYTSVGLILGVFSLITILANIPFGEISDKIGKKKIIKVGFLLYALIVPLYAFSSTVYHFLFVRILNGFTWSSVWIPFTAYIREESPKKEHSETMGIYDLIITLAYIIGILIGAGIAQVYGIQVTFFFWSIGGLIAFLLMHFKLPDSVNEKKEGIEDGIKDTVKKGIYLRSLRDFFKEGKDAKILFTMTTLRNFAITSQGMLFPLLIYSLGADLWTVGLITACLLVPNLGTIYFAKMADLTGKRTLLSWGYFFGAVIFIAISLSNQIPVLLILGILLIFSLSISWPAQEGLLTDFSPKKKEGEFTAVFETTKAIGSAAGAFSMGVIADVFSISTAFLFSAVIFLVCAFLSFKLRKTYKTYGNI